MKNSERVIDRAVVSLDPRRKLPWLTNVRTIMLSTIQPFRVPHPTGARLSGPWEELGIIQR